jgi:hypothetical protein
MADLKELLAIYVHAHKTGNSVPPHIEAQARALLAQPEPEVAEPSDEELLDLMPRQLREDLATVSRLAVYGAGPGVTPGIFRVTLNTGALDFARAILQRYAAPQPCPYIRQGDSDSQWCALAERGAPQPSPVPVAERLPELRGMFERILCVARSSGGPTVGNIQLADRLIDAVVSWSGDALPVPELRQEGQA